MDRTDETLRTWEGHVTVVDEEGFEARLLYVTAGEDLPTQEARIPWSSVPGGRPSTATEGTYLRWRILRGADGATRSEFAFDIAGAWTRDDLDRAAKRAAWHVDALVASSGKTARS